MQIKTKYILITFLIFISFDIFCQNSIDYYFVHYRNIVNVKVIKIKDQKIKLRINEIYKGKWKIGSKHKVEYKRQDFESSLQKDSSYIMIIGGHVRFYEKWKLRDPSHLFIINNDTIFISNELLENINNYNDSISQIEPLVYKTTKIEFVNLIFDLNKTYEYCYSKKKGLGSRMRTGIKKKTEIPQNLTPFQLKVFQHFDKYWMSEKCEN